MPDNSKPPINYGSGNIFSKEYDKGTFFLYDIANYEYPQVIFFYGVTLFIFIYIFTSIDFTFSLFVGLILFTVLLYYIWYYRKINSLNEVEKNNIKIDKINPNQSPGNREDLLINKYPRIVDFMFYMEEFKTYNLNVYNKIIYTFNNIIFLYESCLKDKTLINTYFDTINNLKLNILNNIESFNYTTDNVVYSKKIIKLKDEAENLINEFLSELDIVQKKNIHYNGYNINTKILKKSSVMPFNEFYDANEFIRNTTPVKVSELIVI